MERISKWSNLLPKMYSMVMEKSNSKGTTNNIMAKYNYETLDAAKQAGVSVALVRNILARTNDNFDVCASDLAEMVLEAEAGEYRTKLINAFVSGYESARR
jgi:hypothetical protein